MRIKGQEPFIECGKGWAGLYGPLLDLCAQRGIKVNQIKEKFGTMRFYHDRMAEGTSLDLIIRAAERMSSHVCEECGLSGLEDITTSGSWLKTLCKECRAKRNEMLEQWSAGIQALKDAGE